MSLIQNAPLFQKSYETIKQFHRLRKSFDKGEKYSLGSLTEEALLAILMNILEAGLSHKEWKVAAIDLANKSNEKAKILIRLAHDCAQLQERSYLELEENLNSIGRMLYGWRQKS